MDQSEHTSPAEPEAPTLRRRLLTVLAVLAVAGSLVSLASLRSAGQAPAEVDIAAQAASGPLPVDLAGALPEANQAAPAAPAADAAPAGTTTVTIMNYRYTPAAVIIAAGDTVTWTNHDSTTHNVVVTSGPERFTSPTLQQGQSFSFTFTKAGTYAYYCSLHPDMKASVTVQGGSTPPPSNPPPSTPPSTPPPSTPPTDGCVSGEMLDAFMAHVKSAHLERSLFDQVTDILAIDQYVLTHTVWLETVLQPVFDGTADQVVKDTLAPVIAHINSAHLERSPLQQVNDILAIDQYIVSHTVWLETVLAPLAGQLTC